MRTLTQINQIKTRISNPYSIEDFITELDIIHLINIFDNSQDKIYKNTGPVTLNIVPFLNDTVFVKIINKLKSEIGQFEITAGMFFSTEFPHIIHNDDTFGLSDGVYKGITIPLKIYGSDLVPELCFFDQFYFHGPAKFFNGSNNVPTYYNKQIYEYSKVDGVVTNSFHDNDKLFTHLKSEWLQGLSLNSTLAWKPGSALIFDSVRLHCSSDFRQHGITHKLGISIFTKL
jgi:hypothetical protein